MKFLCIWLFAVLAGCVNDNIDEKFNIIDKSILTIIVITTF